MRLKPLVVMLCEALEASGHAERNRSLQRLGDVSLFMAGFFARGFAAKLIDIDYHIAMGGRAYGALAHTLQRARPRAGRRVRRAGGEIPAHGRCPERDQRERLPAHRPGHPAPVRDLAEDGQHALLRIAEAPRGRSDARRGREPSPTDGRAHAAVAAAGVHRRHLRCARGARRHDFLVTDRTCLPPAARGGTADEELLVAEGGGELALSLYLDPALLARLGRADPLERLHAGNLADWLTALEGVSHFLYLAWNAGHDKPVSLLELEMQAEVDKYVGQPLAAAASAAGALPGRAAAAAVRRARVDAALAAGRAGLYREASRYAEKFCRRLERTLARGPRGAGAEVLAELRRFYRLSHARKRAHIEDCA